MIKIIVLVMASFLFVGASCSVKDDIKNLQKKKIECENLQPELESLDSKKYTKTINDAIKDCEDHGFWEKPKRKKINTYMDGL